MRIGIDARMIRSSGIGRVIENIIKRMIFVCPSWKFFVLGYPIDIGQYSFFQSTNVQIIPCKSPIYSIREQVEFMKKIPNDLDWFWSPHYNIPLFYSGRLLVTVHDVFHLAMPAFVQGVHKRFYAKFMFSRVVGRANKIICVSHFTANELKRLTGASPDKIQIVYNGVDSNWHNADKLARVHSKPYFVYVGNIKPHKNLVRLLEAYANIKDKIEQDLILVGKKEGFITGIGNISKLIENLEDRVFFTGWVEDAVLRTYITQADALIFPSLYEGFGLPPLEAMAAGTPVLVSHAASLPEICGNGALYCNPYDIDDIAKGMQQVICEDRSVQAAAIVQKYSWDRAVTDMVEIFSSV